jgi:hypothetical protein
VSIEKEQSEKGKSLTGLLVEGALSPRNSSVRRGYPQGAQGQRSYMNEGDLVLVFGNHSDTLIGYINEPFERRFFY